MITIIICSRDCKISQQLKDLIKETIGVKYELIVIDNSLNKYSISSAYNEGIRRAHFPYLCFMHDDVLIHTINWGEKVISHFKNRKIGIIGVVGSHYMPQTPSGWYLPHVVSGGCIQRFQSGDHFRSEHKIDLNRFINRKSIEAVAIDGMWFCIPKELFDKVSFDDGIYKGFHCYDLDICFQIRKIGLQVHIISDIVIEHFSSGFYSHEWIIDTLLFYDKWKEILPQVAGVNISSEEMKYREEMIEETFLYISAYAKCKYELDTIRNSNSYRLGRLLIKPLKNLKRSILSK